MIPKFRETSLEFHTVTIVCMLNYFINKFLLVLAQIYDLSIPKDNTHNHQKLFLSQDKHS